MTDKKSFIKRPTRQRVKKQAQEGQGETPTPTDEPIKPDHAEQGLFPTLLQSLHDLVRPGNSGKSIVPERTVGSETLVIVVAIMSFLTCLTYAMVTVVYEQASSWQNDISREVTIQVRPVEGVDIAGELKKARELAQNTPGIKSVQFVDEDWSKRLLQPWLGDDFDLAELPVPRMLVLELDPERRANLKGLSERIANDVKGASLDDHRIWLDRLGSAANTFVFVGVVLMVLMFTAMILSVTFATQGAMSTNHGVVEVLHFVGGRDSFIASEFQRRFFSLGLKGGVVGGGAAILLFFILNLWSQFSSATPEGDQIAALFGRFEIGFLGYVGTLVLVMLVAFVTALASRMAVFRYLTNVS